MNKDYYSILEVGKDYTEEQLKKNYKRLCLKYHPDRQAGKSEEEKKQCEEKFKDVQEAYECLSDPNKRAHYDRFGSMEGYGQGWSAGADMFEQFGSFFEDFNIPGFDNFFGHRKQRNTYRGPIPGETLRMQVGVSIKEILDGGEKTLKYSRKVRCSSCNGTGGEDIDTCPYCHGTGMITTQQRSGWGIVQHSRPCNYCGGTGQTVKHKCNKCNGEGFVTDESTVTIHVPKGCKNGELVELSGKGNESKEKGAPNGDLQIILLHQYDQEKYLVQGNIIYEKLDVPYYDAILGKELELKTPNDKTIKLKLHAGTQDEDNVYGGNVNGYEYRYIISVTTPKTVNKSERKLLEKIRNEK